ncbi:MAG TPA: glutamine--fructose-6-phosphate transaminase (isomerizing) [Gaiellaceae bacterium]|nr:glutamine--fructose-6-phosphate transaminase (isomerizing) [Gaiellaceae bacterium]
MCGLIGFSGRRPAQPILLDGLEHLEYRGYDSAGICLLDESGLSFARAVGDLAALRQRTFAVRSEATAGIGHTRWATHGRVSLENAHPLVSCDEGELALVLNGIVENFAGLRASLSSDGHRFRSETDAEAVAHLIEARYEGDLAEAVQAALADLDGHFAFLAVHRDHPGTLVAARRHCPLVVGIGKDEMFVASMITAFLSETRATQLIEDDEVVVVEAHGARFYAGGAEVDREVVAVDWDEELAHKQGFETFMEKEIHEQPDAVARTLAGRLRDGRPALESVGLDDDEMRSLRRVVVLGCGTAYHAGLMGRYAIEEWARIPAEADIASEWCSRNPLVDEQTLVVAVSQSGETADTLSALRLARSLGARTLAVTNMEGSQITRDADAVLFTRAGLEVGVAATKTFTAQASVLFLLALALGRARGAVDEQTAARLTGELSRLPTLIESFLTTAHPIDEIAERLFERQFFLYLGRHVGLPVCLEGALKLKEISYIPTDAYSAGEMKHGPIALLDEDVPVVCVATDSDVYDKVVSNIQEVRARGAHVIAIACETNEAIQHLVDDTIYVPHAHPFVETLLAVLPLQLLAHRIALLRGLNVDRPRNLAKTVTVE